MEVNKIHQGDCLEVIKDIPDESVDSIVTDPPAGIAFMDKSWDSDKGGRDKWIAWLQEIMEECNRVLKPGAHVVVWALPRTSHWTRMAIDNAGFEIRHIIDHIHASGFPKSQNVGADYDKKKGNERKIVGKKTDGVGKDAGTGRYNWNSGNSKMEKEYDKTKGNSQWEGFGSALKPAHEDWVVARKPLSEKSIVENCIKHGTGALNIDGCRIPLQDEPIIKMKAQKGGNQVYGQAGRYEDTTELKSQGRFPADVIVSDDALNDGKMTESVKSLRGAGGGGDKVQQLNYRFDSVRGHNDSGSKSRYFDLDVWAEKNGIIQTPKPGKKERNRGCEELEKKEVERLGQLPDGFVSSYGNVRNKPKPMSNNHPTVKPIALMAWLVRLITPPDGIVLDPFMGSGTTAVAALENGFKYIGIELSSEYIEIAKQRLEISHKEDRKKKSELTLF